MTERESSPEERPNPSETKDEVPIISTEELFHGEREIRIVHENEVYRLRLTRRGKLILQK